MMTPVLEGLASKWRPIWGGLALGTLLTCGMLVLTIDLYQQTIAQRKQELVTSSILVREAAERTLQAIDLAQRDVLDDMRLKGVATAADLRAYTLPESVYASLRDRIAALPQADAITIIDATGALLNFSRAWPTPIISLADRDYFKRAKSDPAQDGFISAAVANRGDGRLTAYIVRRINAPDGTFLGLVLGSIRLSYFENLYRSILISEHSTITLGLSDGTLLVRVPPAPEFIGKILPVLTTLRPDSINTVVENVAVVDGKRRYVSVHALANYPALVSVAVEIDTVLEPWRREAVLLGLAVVLSDLALAAGVVLTVRQMAAQRQLASVAELAAANRAERQQERSTLELCAATERSAMLASLAAAFEEQVGQMSRAVAAGAGDVQIGAGTVSVLAGDTTTRTRHAAAEASVAAADVDAMAAATMALTGSIETVAAHAVRSAKLVRAAAEAAHDADATMATLTASATHIGEIVNLIGSIAQQTNMLALNATIEAARAGESGRGFAVVAGEIKTLSKAVSRATEDIKRQIHDMQASTTHTAAAMAIIREFVTTVDTIAGDITHSMEHQRAATTQIADAMSSAATSTRVLSAEIGSASQAATKAGATAEAVQAVARTLADQAGALRVASERFLVQVEVA